MGEALVGNEAVDQLVKFNRALADHSDAEDPRLIDGIVLTKFDTIDDKVCWCVPGLVWSTWYGPPGMLGRLMSAAFSLGATYVLTC